MTHVLRRFCHRSVVNRLIQNSRTQLSNALPAVVAGGQDHVAKPLLRPGAALPASGAEVLADVQHQLPKLSAQDLLYALRKLASVNYDVASGDPTFQSLCEAFASRARGLSAHQLVEAARSLARLQIPADASPVAVTLQLLRCQLDQLELRQITRLDDSVRRINANGRTHLTDALQEALPLAFSTRLPLEFDSEDPHFLGKALLYACEHAPHPICIERLVDALLPYGDNLDARVAADVLVALCNVNCMEKMHPDRARLVRDCEDRLARSLPNFAYGEVARLAGALGRRLRAPHMEYYHEELVDALGLYAGNCEKLWQALKLAQPIWAARHVHYTFATRLSELAERERETTLNALWPTNLLILIECLADARIEVHTDVLKQLAIATFSGRPGDWIRLNVALTALGHHDDALLQRALSSQALEHASGGDRARVLAQWEQAALGRGGDRPREGCVPLVLTELARELGGVDFVARDVHLPDGVVADGVVCVAEGRPLMMESKPGKKLNPPSGALLVCVLVLPDEWYSRNGHRARAGARLTEAAARRAGRAVVTVIPEKWMSTAPRERGPLLTRALHDVCADHGMPLLL